MAIGLGISPADHAHRRPLERSSFQVIYSAGGLGIGWLITQLQPSSRGAMVLLCAVSFVLPLLPTTVRLAINSFEHARFAIYLLDQVLLLSLVSIGVTIGGFLGIPPADPGVLGEPENSKQIPPNLLRCLSKLPGCVEPHPPRDSTSVERRRAYHSRIVLR
jgi:hypothetical protein